MQSTPGDKRRIGKAGENLAVSYLTRTGLRPLFRNYQCKQGEIDLIAHDRGTVVFVEVRLRKNSSRGSAAETVTPAKQRKIVLCARHFLMTHPRYDSHPCRFDILGIDVEKRSGATSYQWLKNAFDCPW